jgi:hypothetical protein
MEEARSERKAAHTSTRGGRICYKHNEEAATILEEAAARRYPQQIQEVASTEKTKRPQTRSALAH